MLDKYQKELIVDSWTSLAENKFKTMLAFYNGLFKLAPEVRYYFPEDMNNMAEKLEKTVDIVVDNVDDLSKIIPALHQLGRYHKHKVGVEPSQYKVVIQALLIAIKRALVDAEMEESKIRDTVGAWKFAFVFVSKNMLAAPPEPDNVMVKFFKKLFSK